MIMGVAAVMCRPSPSAVVPGRICRDRVLGWAPPGAGSPPARAR